MASLTNAQSDTDITHRSKSSHFCCIVVSKIIGGSVLIGMISKTCTAKKTKFILSFFAGAGAIVIIKYQWQVEHEGERIIIDILAVIRTGNAETHWNANG